MKLLHDETYPSFHNPRLSETYFTTIPSQLSVYADLFPLWVRSRRKVRLFQRGMDGD